MIKIVLFLSETTYIRQNFHQASRQLVVPSSFKKGRCPALISNPTSPSDAMNIVLDLLREIVVDHVLHIRDIQATSSNRRSYEYWGTAVTKISQSIFALLLASVSKMDESVCKLKNLTFIFDLSKRIILLSFTLITIAKMRYTDDYCTRTVPSTSILTLSVVHCLSSIVRQSIDYHSSVYRLSFVGLSSIVRLCIVYHLCVSSSIVCPSISYCLRICRRLCQRFFSIVCRLKTQFSTSFELHLRPSKSQDFGLNCMNRSDRE